MHFPTWFVVAGLGTLACFLGCGSGSNLTVTGTLAIDGKPVEKGTVSFTPMVSGQGEAVTTEVIDGKFVARGVPKGFSRVLFIARQETGKSVTNADPAEGSTHPEVIDLVPGSYRNGIEIELTQSNEPLNFNLTSK